MCRGRGWLLTPNVLLPAAGNIFSGDLPKYENYLQNYISFSSFGRSPLKMLPAAGNETFGVNSHPRPRHISPEKSTYLGKCLTSVDNDFVVLNFIEIDFILTSVYSLCF